MTIRTITLAAILVAVPFSIYLFEKQRSKDQLCIQRAHQATLIKGVQLEGFPQPKGHIAELAYSHYFKEMGPDEFSEHVFTNCHKGFIK